MGKFRAIIKIEPFWIIVVDEMDRYSCVFCIIGSKFPTEIGYQELKLIGLLLILEGILRVVIWWNEYFHKLLN